MASKFPFIGSSYTERSINWDDQRTLNLYPVAAGNSYAKSPAALVGTPGLLAFITLPVSPIRALYKVDGVERSFAVAGNKLYEIFSDFTYTERGTLLTSVGAVDVADNGAQLCIVDGANGYILTFATDVFGSITTNWRGSNTVAYLHGYFMWAEPDTNVYYWSAINDGYTIDPLDFASAEGSPDNIVAIQTIHEQFAMLGTSSIEFIYDAGTSPNPFARVQGVFVEYGCAAPQSVVKSANTMFWLGSDKEGTGLVFMANGYQPQKISTQAVELAIQSYSDISDAVGYTYQEDGHYFYVLNFPQANTTWVYDINVEQWHERAYFFDGEYSRHLANSHIFAFNKHLVGDYQSGIIYEQSLAFNDDNGVPKRWLRRCPHIADTLQYIYYKSLQIDMQMGIGLNDGGIQDTDPQLMLRWSDDGGYTWSNEHTVSAGKIGQYKARAIWRRLGRSRDRIFEVAGVFNCKTFLINGLLDTEAGSN